MELTLITTDLGFTLVIIGLALTFVAAVVAVVYYGTKDLGGRDSDF